MKRFETIGTVKAVLANPAADWGRVRNAARGSARYAFRDLKVDWELYNNEDYLFTHDTIVASVATEADGYTIKPGCWDLVNANGNAWTNAVLKSCYKTFIGGENYCFPAGTRVLMADGTYKPIEEIKEGERVINANGEEDTVIKTFARSYAGEMTEFSSPNILSKKLLCTVNHPMRVYHDRGTCAVTGKSIPPQRKKEHPIYDDAGIAAGHRKGNLTESRWGTPQYLSASDLSEERDLLMHPIPNKVVECPEMNENRAFLAGWFLAEGSYIHNGHGITLALGKNEYGIAEELCGILEKEFPEKNRSGVKRAKNVELFLENACYKRAKICKTYNPKTGLVCGFVVSYYSTSAADFLMKWCGKYAWGKEMPKEALLLPLDLQRIILRQYIAGDGYEKGPSRGATVNSRSQRLIQQMRLLAIRLGAFPNYREIGVLKRYSQMEMKEGYPVYCDPATGKLCRPGYVLNFTCEDWHKIAGGKPPKHSSVSTRFGNDFVFRFEKRTLETDEIVVYNLEVQNDHSYIVEGVAAHNCDHLQVPSLSKGKILDAVLREVDHGGEKIWVCDILVATSRRHKSLVERIERGELNTMSMGATANFVQCSICGKIFDTHKEERLCEHLARNLGEEIDYGGKKKKCAELCGAIDPTTGEYIPDSCVFIEASWVEQPAFEGAVTNYIVETPQVAAARKERGDLESAFRAALVPALRVADRPSRFAIGELRRADKIARIAREALD